MSSILRVPTRNNGTGEWQQENLFCLWSDGLLAVCQSHDYDDLLTVTHVPTGCVVISCDSLSEGRHYIEALERCGIDWNFARVEDAKPLEKQALRLLQRLHNNAFIKATETVAKLVVRGKGVPPGWKVEPGLL